MKHTKSIIFHVVALALSAGICAAALNVLRQARHTTTKTITKVDTITYVDTITFYTPVPRDSTIVRYMTAILPKAIPKDTTNTIPMLLDSSAITRQTGVVDSIPIVVPISQVVYEDTTFRAYVSGFHAQLDSLFVYPQHKVITITQSGKARRWTLGLQAGYGITPKGGQPYVGIGIAYSIIW